MTRIRVLLADDHAILRSGLSLLIAGQPDMEVVGEAADGLTALNQAEALQPDVVLLDLSMPGLGGLEVLPLLRQAVPGSRVLILTMHEDEHYLQQVLRTGAAGYILKKAADTELLAALRAVARGDVYVHPTMTRGLLTQVMPDAFTPDPDSDEWADLSEREREVLLMVALGHTGREIAEGLSISVKTVETYRARGMEKLGLRSRAALVKYALSHGLLDQL